MPRRLKFISSHPDKKSGNEPPSLPLFLLDLIRWVGNIGIDMANVK